MKFFKRSECKCFPSFNEKSEKFFEATFRGEAKSASGLIKKYFAYSRAEFDSKLAENLISMSVFFSRADEMPEQPCKKLPNLENVE